MVPVASHYVLMKKTQVVQDKDLLTLEAFARHETMRLPELARWHAKHPNIAPSFNGKSRDGSKSMAAYLLWRRRHLIHIFCRMYRTSPSRTHFRVDA